MAVYNNSNMLEKWQEKKTKCEELAVEIPQMWYAERVEVVPVIVSPPGLIPKNLHGSFTKLDLKRNIYTEMQKAPILKTCRIVRKSLSVL